MTVPAPKVDPLAVSTDNVDPRPFGDLVAVLMEARDCPRPAAVSHIEDIGLVAAENEARARWD